MSWRDMFDKLDDIIYAPVKLATDWAGEPLRRWEDQRKEKSADNQLRRDIERKSAEEKISSEHADNQLKREIERKTAEKRIEAEIRMKEKEKDSELFAEIEKEKAEIKRIESEIRMREKEKNTNLDIRKATEVQRILTEIEELRKDQHFQRMKAVSEAIMKFQTELTRLNVEAVNSIGNMQLELREKAQNLVYTKTIKYKELQDVAMEEAIKDFERVETKFANNEVAKKVLNAAIEKRLANIIDTANNFLIELNNDIKILNERITLLAESGQKFIENHLGHFHSIGFENQNVKSIEKDPKGLKDPKGFRFNLVRGSAS